MYIGDTLARRAIYTPNALAVIDAGKLPDAQYTYAQLNDRANRFANWLKEAGIGRGDHVGILANNGVEFLDVFFACGKLGAIFVGFDHTINWQQLTEMVNRTKPKAMLFSDDFADTIAHILFETDSIRALLNIEGYNVRDTHHFEDVLQNSSPEPVTTEGINDGDVACVIFTTAESGMPEAIPISYRAIAWNTLSTIINHSLQSDDIVMNSFPLFRIGGLLVNALPSLIIGSTILLAPQSNPDRLLSLIDAYDVSILAGLPELYEKLPTASNWSSVDLSSLRFCTSGGTPLPVKLVNDYQQNKRIGFKQGFGLSAFGSNIFALAQEDALRKSGSIGRPSFFVDARIIDKNNKIVPEGEVGELILKGPNVAFNSRITQEKIDEAGWLHTGDLARYDSEWFFYIVEHNSNLFKSEESSAMLKD